MQCPLDHGRRSIARSLLPLLLLASCGVFGGPDKEHEALIRYQQNAQIYWDNGNLDQSLDQVRRGLEIDPENYKLLTIQAWATLRRSATEPDVLPTAEKQFDHLLSLRDESDHSPQVRLGYAKTQGKRAVELLQRANDLEEQSKRDPSGVDHTQEAATLRADAEKYFARAVKELKTLVDRGEELLLAHYDLMSLLWWRGDYDGAVAEGNAYLERAAQLEERQHRELRRTLQVDYEQQVREDLQQLIDDELEVRVFMANMHYKRGHPELAVEQLDEVLRREPDRYNDYYNRGMSLLALGRTEEARRDLQKFLATTQLSQESDQVKDALRVVQGSP